MLASSDARHFELRPTPRQLGLRDVLVAGDSIWTCGEYGQLARSRDRGATWKPQADEQRKGLAPGSEWPPDLAE